jgi:hypothetical protein
LLFSKTSSCSEFPDGFRRAELLVEVHVAHVLDALGQHLRRAADGVEIDAPMLLARRQRSGSHATFADDAAHAEIADDLPLVRLLTDGGRGSGSRALPGAVRLFHDYGSAMIKNPVA